MTLGMLCQNGAKGRDNGYWKSIMIPATDWYVSFYQAGVYVLALGGESVIRM